MTALFSRRLIVLTAVVAGVLVLGAIGAWIFRDSIATWPVVGWSGAPAEPAHQHATAEPPPPSGDQAPGAGDPRAPVRIDGRRQQLIGVRTVAAERTALNRTVRAVGVVRYDETRITDVNLRVDGWIEELYVDSTGQAVGAGDRLFTLYSPDLVATQNEYLLALRSRRELAGSALADARIYADRLVEAARRRHELWDLPADQIAELEKTGNVRTHLVFRSPASGFVVEKTAVRGLRVMAGQSLYRLADLSSVWVEADLYEQDLPFVRVGDSAKVALDAYPGEAVTGRVVYIYPYADEQARTVRARFALENREHRYRPGSYATVELASNLGRGVTVPTDAVLDSGRDSYVFLAEGDGYFQPRRVETGRRLDGRVEIRTGLAAGEMVATGATFFIDSESQLRAAIPGFEPASSAPATKVTRDELQVEFSTEPDPPSAGDNTFVVMVRTASGEPVADASVTVTLFMPAMPSMNMPAMRSQAPLLAQGNGQYRGRVGISMAGRWDVTIVVTRTGRTIGRVERAVIAR